MEGCKNVLIVKAMEGCKFGMIINTVKDDLCQTVLELAKMLGTNKAAFHPSEGSMKDNTPEPSDRGGDQA